MLSQIRGQTRAVGLLRRAVSQGRVAHAYLFCGPAGCGKYTTGLAFAAALNCVTTPGEGCGHCASCERIAAGNHPDVRTLERQGAAQIIPIETIRTQVIPLLSMPPHEGACRVFLIEEGAALHGASANAMLKTLEEPPPRTHFIVCTTAPDQLLPTIRSRCQRVSFAALDAALRAELEDDTETAERLLGLVDQICAAAQRADVEVLHQAVSAVTSAREDVIPTLDMLARRLHRDARHAALEHRMAEASRLSRQTAIVLSTQQAVAQNAHGQMALEAMLYQLRAVIA